MSHILVGLFGPMGSGKSYEAMEYHVLPALKSGQRVATNVEGLLADQQLQAISLFTGRTVEELRSLIVTVPKTKEELFAPGIWPDPLDWSKPSLIPPGSKLVLDECSTIFNREPPEHVMRYLTQQRHGVDAHGNVGNTVIISQSSKIHHSVRGIMSVAYLFSKFSMLEPFMKLLRPLKLGKDYRAEVYTDMSKTIGRSKPDSLITRRYNPRVFPCYKSVDASEFKRLGLDGRTTILGNRYVMIFIPVMLGFAWYAGSKLYSMFGGAMSAAPSVTAPVAPGKPPVSATPLSGDKLSVATPIGPRNEFDQGLSSDYRYVGQFVQGDLRMYLLQHKSGSFRWIGQAEIKRAIFAGPAVMLELYDGTRITPYTGASNVSSTPSAAAPVSAAAPAVR